VCPSPGCSRDPSAQPFRCHHQITPGPVCAGLGSYIFNSGRDPRGPAGPTEIGWNGRCWTPNPAVEPRIKSRSHPGARTHVAFPRNPLVLPPVSSLALSPHLTRLCSEKRPKNAFEAWLGVPADRVNAWDGKCVSAMPTCSLRRPPIKPLRRYRLPLDPGPETQSRLRKPGPGTGNASQDHAAGTQTLNPVEYQRPAPEARPGDRKCYSRPRNRNTKPKPSRTSNQFPTKPRETRLPRCGLLFWSRSYGAHQNY
jgi:hypothetical protein